MLARHGVRQRFEVNSSGIERSIMGDGTIINTSPPDVMQKLGNAGASIGLVSDDPVASGEAAAAFLKSRGHSARVVLDAEPNLPIAYVVGDAMVGTVINFRKHVTEMPAPKWQAIAVSQTPALVRACQSASRRRSPGATELRLVPAHDARATSWRRPSVRRR